MKASSILLMTILVIGSLVSSCNPEEDDNNDGTNTFTDLTFSYTVTGEISQNGTWESPENNQNLGGHDNSVICNYSGPDDQFLIVGIGNDYSYSLEADFSEMVAGTYNLTDVIFSDNNSSFEQVVSGTITLDEVEVNFEVPPTITYYTAFGSFTAEVNNSNTPPQSITFNGTFEGLNVTATN